MKNETYNICLDCNTEMVVYAETFELVCESCGRAETLVGVVFDETQFFSQEGQTGQPTPTEKSDSYLRKTLEKYKILDAVNVTMSDSREVYDPVRYRFLGNVLYNFCHDGKSTKFVCFLHDYFQAVSSEAWPRKNEILELLIPRLPKIEKTRLRSKERFGNISGGKNSYCGETFAVFSLNFCWYFHAKVADKVRQPFSA